MPKFKGIKLQSLMFFFKKERQTCRGVNSQKLVFLTIINITL